jgi:hypothetical protein
VQLDVYESTMEHIMYLERVAAKQAADKAANR